MHIKEWLKDQENINFNRDIKSEADLKIKVLLPYLKEIGYDEKEMRFENSINVVLGSKETTVFSDVEILIDGVPQLIIDTKKPTHTLTEKDIRQASSYAKLISTPSALYSTAYNGIDCITTNTITGEQFKGIPSKAELIRDLDRNPQTAIFSEVELREAKSTLFTILQPEDLYNVIKKTKVVIETKGAIRSDESFREMTKILLVKMNEERRALVEHEPNRFSKEYLEKSSLVNNTTQITSFVRLFDQALDSYPQIYDRSDVHLKITSDKCINEVVDLLEPFSFLGTGDDIKGSVYEIFLKSTLRGDFDQYFTPREMVEFMVAFADIKPGEKFVDPSCGSGGFLINGFNSVNNKIHLSAKTEKELNELSSDLIEKSIWGQEIDYDLHVLAKINMIMHGDGWNNIYQGDTLSTNYLPENFFDIVLTNPPFTLPYDDVNVLSEYELGIGQNSVELDLLFVEKGINLLKPGGEMYIVLPEGLLNNGKYKNFRNWLLEQVDLIYSISLPEGAFIPFGGSVSKTAILGFRKKDNSATYNPPQYVFVGKANEVGFEVGKKSYKQKEKNDLSIFINDYNLEGYFEGIRETEFGGEYGFLEQKQIKSNRIDGAYLVNVIDLIKIEENFEKSCRLGEVVEIENITITIEDDVIYNYLEVPDISSDTGLIGNIRKIKGSEINNKKLRKMEPGDIIFTKINPRKGRTTIVPSFEGIGVMSPEIFNLKIIAGNSYISEDQKYAIPILLKSQQSIRQIVRLATGSSSSRARVPEVNLLRDVIIPIPDPIILNNISNKYREALEKYWDASQKTIEYYVHSQNLLGEDLDSNSFRGV